jgi:hypothetical protein
LFNFLRYPVADISIIQSLYFSRLRVDGKADFFDTLWMDYATITNSLRSVVGQSNPIVFNSRVEIFPINIDEYVGEEQALFAEQWKEPRMSYEKNLAALASIGIPRFVDWATRHIAYDRPATVSHNAPMLAMNSTRAAAIATSGWRNSMKYQAAVLMVREGLSMI